MCLLSRELMGFADIDDVKNGLLLFKPLKHAFIYDKDSNEFRLKVFDHSLRPNRLFQNLNDNECKILLKDQTLPKYWKKDDPDDPPCGLATETESSSLITASTKKDGEALLFDGCGFPARIDENETVGGLKDAIQRKKPNRIKCDPVELQLFLAKKTTHGWIGV
ncbi:Crinkler (CRN), partial [Phytophthora megakarya]